MIGAAPGADDAASLTRGAHSPPPGLVRAHRGRTLRPVAPQFDEFNRSRRSLLKRFEKRRPMMGKLVVTEFVSIDGVFEDPGGAEGYEHGGWTFEYDRGEDGDKFKMDELMEADVQLLGRRTYDGFAAAWPSRDGPFADKINNGAKYVVSSTLTDPEWQNTTVISGDAVEGVSKLKEETDGTIIVAGSGTLVRALLAANLVDELRLMVFPTILGRGQRLFPDGIDRLKLKLAESRTVGPDGVQVQVYTRAR
jgi:dihydrofolate reductase